MSIFPDAEIAYEYKDGGYIQATNLKPGIGYWIKVKNDFSYTIWGTLLTKCLQGPQGEQGEQGPPGIQGPSGISGKNGIEPEHRWNETSLQFKKPDGSWGDFVNLKGNDGLVPEHKWNGTLLSFQKPNGTWGVAIDLKGDKGDSSTITVNTNIQDDSINSNHVKNGSICFEDLSEELKNKFEYLQTLMDSNNNPETDIHERIEYSINSSEFTKVKEFEIIKSGNYTVNCEYGMGFAPAVGSGALQFRKNEISFYTSPDESGIWATANNSITATIGDRIQIYAKKNWINGGDPCRVRNISFLYSDSK
ncbi:MAG: hypothetical protein OMM_13059 [Candidatus Magnetoglobus multicellularis str. Araruama]|uniref:Collagen-like protein n=1 Tax=Candidatus Magnetoglobus multicellularis str. Araruama TaxID=890399 RepID=A0A1V1NUL4_9BACT|nr:MAG: hypothetical protein OMM_13059 [Candidatus Magnetoglobus multicellularis str. Araruama]